jgi:hypothetical protein
MMLPLLHCGSMSSSSGIYRVFTCSMCSYVGISVDCVGSWALVRCDGVSVFAG